MNDLIIPLIAIAIFSFILIIVIQVFVMRPHVKKFQSELEQYK